MNGESEEPARDEFEVGTHKVKGLRTFVLALIITVAYIRVALETGDAAGLKELAIIAFGFFFAKTVQ